MMRPYGVGGAPGQLSVDFEKVPLWLSSSCSRSGWLVEGAVSEHGEEDVDTTSGECDEGCHVVFPFAAFAVVVGTGLGLGQRGERGEVEGPFELFVAAS